MPELIKALNAKKRDATIEFKAGRNVRTEIQDMDTNSNSCGLYSFTYWAALMITQDIEAYKRVRGAAADGRLSNYYEILSATNYRRPIATITQVEDLSKANEIWGSIF